MTSILCPACHIKLPAGATACPDCGWLPRPQTGLAPSEPAPLLCINPNCGVANPPGERNCVRCGELLPAPSGTLLHGRYRLEQFLKAGGFGAIYRAHDTANQDQVVVVKEMIVADPQEFDTRLNFFKREFEILRLLNKRRVPSVPKYYGFYQEEEKQTAHLVIEYLAGQNLLEILEANGSRPFDLAQVVEWGKTICDVVAVMHAERPPYIHRDIKPDNIMLLPDGSIKMIDFGTARQLKDSQSRSPLTRVYSEDYAAPEQRRGTPEPQSDLFALAATLYHLATGKVPVGDQTVQATLLSTDAAIRPEERWFYELLKVNLALNPNERYPSVTAFKEDLEQKRVRRRAEFPDADRPSPPPPLGSQAPASTLPSQPTGPAPSSMIDLAGFAAKPAVGSNPHADVWGPPVTRRSPALVVLFALVLVIGGGSLLAIYMGWIPPIVPSSGTRVTPTSPIPPPVPPPSKKQNDDRPFTSKRDTLNVMRDDLQGLPVEDRPSYRYFTLDHLYNNPRLSREVLNQHRDALNQLLAPFNRNKTVVIDALGDGTVYRVDIRRLGWDRSGAWHKILAAYPYGLLNPDIQEMEKQAGYEVPFVRADWFVASAAVNPLFSKLAGPDALPGNPPPSTPAISTVQDLYHKDLHAQEVALELGLRFPEELRQELDKHPVVLKLLARRGLGALTEGGSVPRKSWAAVGGFRTPFQEVAVGLGLAPASLRVRE